MFKNIEIFSKLVQDYNDASSLSQESKFIMEIITVLQNGPIFLDANCEIPEIKTTISILKKNQNDLLCLIKPYMEISHVINGLLTKLQSQNKCFSLQNSKQTISIPDLVNYISQNEDYIKEKTVFLQEKLKLCQEIFDDTLMKELLEHLKTETINGLLKEIEKKNIEFESVYQKRSEAREKLSLKIVEKKSRYYQLDNDFQFSSFQYNLCLFDLNEVNSRKTLMNTFTQRNNTYFENYNEEFKQFIDQSSQKLQNYKNEFLEKAQKFEEETLHVLEREAIQIRQKKLQAAKEYALESDIITHTHTMEYWNIFYSTTETTTTYIKNQRKVWLKQSFEEYEKKESDLFEKVNKSMNGINSDTFSKNMGNIGELFQEMANLKSIDLAKRKEYWMKTQHMIEEIAKEIDKQKNTVEARLAQIQSEQKKYELLKNQIQEEIKIAEEEMEIKLRTFDDETSKIKSDLANLKELINKKLTNSGHASYKSVLGYALTITNFIIMKEQLTANLDKFLSFLKNLQFLMQGLKKKLKRCITISKKQKDNESLLIWAQKCFPTFSGFQKVLNDQRVSPESILSDLTSQSPNDFKGKFGLTHVQYINVKKKLMDDWGKTPEEEEEIIDEARAKQILNDFPKFEF